MTTIDSSQFRQVLGQFPTGVVVITAMDHDGEAIGMTVGSFTSVSLDPPLVAFLPSKTSKSWRTLHDAGDSFCVNVLGAHQEDVCRAVATRPQNKFQGFGWTPTARGNPVLEGAVAYIDCSVEAIHDAGDHEIVVGRVHELSTTNPTGPLLFFRGGYGSFTPSSLAAGDADLLEQLRLVDLARPHMERLAADFSTEVTAITLVRDELVLTASAGSTDCVVAPTRVGHRVPLVPPLGSIHAAWGGDEFRRRWVAALDSSFPPAYQHVPDLVRSRGFSVTFDHAPNAHLESVTARLHRGDHQVSPHSLSEAIRNVAASYNPESLQFDGERELRSMAAPVFTADGDVAFALTLWGPQSPVDQATLERFTTALLTTAQRATEAICTHNVERKR